MRLRIMWPEGEPEQAVFVSNRLTDWWNSMLWSLRMKRTTRLSGHVTRDQNPVVQARLCERMLTKRFG